METTQQQRAVIFENLPESIKEVFTNYETTRALIAIGNTHNLSEEDRRTLGKAVGLVLMGVLKRKEFQDYLYENMTQEKATIDSIIKATQPIFQPIAGQLEKLNPRAILHEAKQAEAAKEKAGGSMPVPPPPPVPGSGYGGTSDPYREPTESN